MCLIFTAWQLAPAATLVVAANRDEYHDRDTAPLHWWDDEDILAGRDLEAGGTWMGVTRSGRFAAVTNYRSAEGHRTDAESRGALVADFLRGSDAVEESLRRVVDGGRRYNGFSMIAGDGERLGWCSNRVPGVHVLAPGLYGLSNHLLDTPWPKVAEGKIALEPALSDPVLDPRRLLAVLDDRRPAPDARLPDTGVGRERERWLSSRFVVGDAYGTRSSSVLAFGTDGTVSFAERTFDRHGSMTSEAREAFTLVSATVPE